VVVLRYSHTHYPRTFNVSLLESGELVIHAVVQRTDTSKPELVELLVRHSCRQCPPTAAYSMQRRDEETWGITTPKTYYVLYGLPESYAKKCCGH